MAESEDFGESEEREALLAELKRLRWIVSLSPHDRAKFDEAAKNEALIRAWRVPEPAKRSALTDPEYFHELRKAYLASRQMIAP